MEFSRNSRFRWLRFSLRTLLACVTILCIYIGWALNWKRQRDDFFKTENVVVFPDQRTDAPLWLHIIGEEGKTIIYASDLKKGK